MAPILLIFPPEFWTQNDWPGGTSPSTGRSSFPRTRACMSPKFRRKNQQNLGHKSGDNKFHEMDVLIHLYFLIRIGNR